LIRLKVVPILLGVFLCTPAVAQLAALKGRVLDESGSGVPGAIVALTRTGTPPRTVTSSVEGDYSFTDLQPGDYSISASAPQLATSKPQRITVATSLSAAYPYIILSDNAFALAKLSFSAGGSISHASISKSFSACRFICRCTTDRVSIAGSKKVA